MFVPVRTLILAASLAAAPAARATTVPQPPVVRTPGPSATATAQTADGTELTGTFRVTAGACEAEVTGTWFRMIQPGGDAAGPYVTNTDSPCSDETYTPLAPGSDGGLVTGTYQSHPDPPFDSNGGGAADHITEPQRFFGVDFATATNPTDPQTGTAVPAPSIRVGDDGSLSGDVRSFAAAWNNQHFNQGAPKPDGSAPGATSGPAGSYDAATGAFELEWTSQIVGGPFNNFTGQWHLEGTFSPAGGSSAGSSSSTTAPATDERPLTAAVTSTSTTSTSALASTGPALPARAPVIALALGLAGLTVLRLRRHDGGV